MSTVSIKSPRREPSNVLFKLVSQKRRDVYLQQYIGEVVVRGLGGHIFVTLREGLIVRSEDFHMQPLDKGTVLEITV